MDLPAQPGAVQEHLPGGHAGMRAHQRREREWRAYRDVVERLKVLERAPVFFALEPWARRALAGRLRRMHFASGERIVCQGEAGDTIFIVEEGLCRLVVERPPSVCTVALLTESDFFGEGAAVFGKLHDASVYAEGDVTLLALDRTSYLAVLGGSKVVAEELRKVADQRSALCADMAVRATWGTSDRGATVIAVYSPKGGSGGTTLSLNLVGALARRFPGQALLVDMDLPYAHSALLSGLSPTGSIARAGAAPADSFDEVLLSAVLYHPAGPMILAGAVRPEESDEVTPELLNRALAVLRKAFRYVVVDLGVALSDVTLATFDQAQQVLLVAAPELSAVKSAADALDILRRLGLPHDALTVVLNRTDQRPNVDRWAVGQILKRPVDVEVGFDGARPEQAALSGSVLSVSNPRSELAKASEVLADLLEARHGRDAARQWVLAGREGGT